MSCITAEIQMSQVRQKWINHFKREFITWA